MAKEGDTYYIFHTGVNIPVKTSKDMKRWSNAGVVVNENGTWHRDLAPDRAGNIWAPDISFRDGKWWLYYSMSTGGSPNSVIGLLTSPTLANPQWTHHGVVVSSPTTFAGFEHCSIDPNFVQDTAGNAWLTWGSLRRTNIIQLDKQTGKVLAGARPIRLAQNAPASEQEASFIIHTRGWYYYFSSWDKCCWQDPTNYNMRFARSRSITGPYLDKSGARTLDGAGTLLDDGSGLAGGHQGLYKENDRYYFLYHVYQTTTRQSSLDIRHLFFDGDDWPTFDDPARTIVHEAENITHSASGAAARLDTNANFSRGRGVLLNANSAGDYIEFPVQVPAAGTYRVKLVYKTAGTRGTYGLSIDGAAQGPTVDMRVGPGIYERVRDFGSKTFASRGTAMFRFTVSGTAGTGFDGSFDAIRLISEEPLATSIRHAGRVAPKLAGPVNLTLTDLSGKTIATSSLAGVGDPRMARHLKGQDFKTGTSVLPGLYILRMQAKNTSETRRIIVD